MAGAAVACRSYSAPLQRVLTDFGAEQSFAGAAARVAEHYGIKVPAGAVRRVTEAHAGQLLAQEQVQTALPAHAGWDCVIGELDGSMVPLVKLAADSACDHRRTRTVYWQEARLALAQRPESVTPRYGVTMGSVAEAGARLWDCAIRVGAGAQTRVHCVSDGAPWISEQVERCFGAQGEYLVDFYHVSEYLAAAGAAIAGPQAPQWLAQRQQELQQNQLAQVLAALAPHVEGAAVAEAAAPVRRCQRYLSQRAEQLNYRAALAAGLPIGSGAIESGHRSVVQARLKLTGAWWRRENAEKMLALRVVRANGEWLAYWQQQRQAEAGF